jgi:hypothetical protein
MTVNRVEQQECVKRLNELERVVPIYRQALEHIADTNGSGTLGRIADRALREALIPRDNVRDHHPAPGSLPKLPQSIFNLENDPVRSTQQGDTTDAPT